MAPDRELQLGADSDASGRLHPANGVIGPSGFFGGPARLAAGRRVARRPAPFLPRGAVLCGAPCRPGAARLSAAAVVTVRWLSKPRTTREAPS